MHDSFLDRRLLIGAAGLAGIAAVSKLAHAGPLNPPAGSVGPTGKTTDEIYQKVARTDAGLAEPRTPIQSLPGTAAAQYVVSQPGSYYLTANIAGVAGKAAIRIDADDVELDLGGFTLSGVPGTLAAVHVADGRRNIGISNGSIRGWRDISILAEQATSVRVCAVRCVGSNSYGGLAFSGTCMRLGDRGVISRCQILDCLGSVCSISFDGLVEDNLHLDGDGSCFFSIARTVMRRNIARRNNGESFYVQEFGVITGNVSAVNSGISAGNDALVADNVIESANFNAIRADGPRSRILNNTITCSSTAIAVSTAGTIVQGNRVFSNGDGIVLQAGATNCLVTGNSVRAVGAAYTIPAGNAHGPVVNIAGAGNIAAVANANHPWANFAY